MNNKRMNTLVDILSNQNEKTINKVLYTFLSGGDSLDVTCGSLDLMARNAAAYLQTRYKKGDRLILALKPGIDFVSSFFGCLYAGLVPVPLYPPLSPSYIHKIEHVINDSTPRGIITSCDLGEVGKNLDWNRQKTDVIYLEQFTGDWGQHWVKPDIKNSDIAFLQYTSGSTFEPKGVMVTHENIIHNEILINKGFGFEKNRNITGVSWLPVYHDMGLIGVVLQACVFGFKAVLMSPLDFLADPLAWLESIEKYKACISGGPNFAYDLCVRRYDAKRCEKLDLSCWEIAFSGAEPVRDDTMDRFFSLYSRHGFRKDAFSPCYGLAENTLFVSCVSRMKGIHAIHVDKDDFSKGVVALSDKNPQKNTCLISNGCTPPGQVIRIVDPEKRDCLSENRIGEIWVKGTSVAKGYWNKPALSIDTFQACTIEGDGPFLRTGDLGFIHKGELYIAGRLKDMMIFRGRNYYPQDIEQSVEKSCDFIRPGRIAAFSLNDELCIVAEYSGNTDAGITGDLLGSIQRQIKKDHELIAADILLVPPKSLPITTSGKIRRNDSRKSYERLGFQVIDRLINVGEAKDMDTVCPVRHDDEDDLRYTLTSKLTAFFNLFPDEIDPDQPFGNYGLTSSEAVELSGDLERITGKSCSPTVLYDYPTVNRLVAFFTDNEGKEQIKTISNSARQRDCNGDIAVIGASCRFPGSEGLDDFWRSLEQGKHCVSEFPDDVRGAFLQRVKGNFAKCGGFIKDIDAFDADFFRINVREARLMDPQQRVFLQTVWHAFENSGYAPGKLAGEDVGVFVGVSSFDYHDVIRESGLELEAYMATGLAHTMIANRISYLLDFHGPSEAIDTACSSSLVAVYRAISSIRQGDCSMAVAGGVNILISPDNFTTLGRSGFLSSRGKCSTFDRHADGYVRGEGAGAVILKPLAQALKDGDHIHAVIKSVAVSHGGRTESLTAPGARSQAGLVVKAVQNAGVDPSSIGYIETHGTGTVLGDPIEVNGLLMAFQEMYRNNGGDYKKATCALGSVKSNIGHLESAAGIAGLIKAMECLKRKTILPAIHMNDLNPLIEMDNTPFYIAGDPKPWVSPKDTLGQDLPRRAGISSFGFGGSYAHVVLEEHENAVTLKEPRECLIVLSSKTSEGLKSLIESHLVWIEDKKNRWTADNGFFDFAFTLAEGRDHYNHRFAVVTDSCEKMICTMETFVKQGKGEDDVFLGTLENVYKNRPCATDDLRAAAAHWVKGGAVNFEALRHGEPFKKIPLPGYVFDKKRYFAFDMEMVKNSKGTAGLIENKRGDGLKRHYSFAELVTFLNKTIAQIMGHDETTIDPDQTFDGQGMDSISVISMINSLEDLTGLEIPPTAVQDYRTINNLARFVADGAVESKNDIDLISETELDEFLFVKGTPPASTQGKAVFLTGATGYLGSYLLVELLSKTDADIYCLVRAEDEDQGRARLIEAARCFGSADDLPDHRIHIVPGDLGSWLLGLERKKFNHLCSVIDTIWHCGALVDWMKPYEALKNTNVEGTREIIRMAGTTCLKSLHFISSLAVLPLVEGCCDWYEKEVNDPRGITAGYGQSKWVSEQLCLKARSWGIPVSVYRFDYVAGIPGKGVMKESDFIARLIKGCIQLGCIPLEETNFDIIPVDYLCRMMLGIACSGDEPGKIYHLLNRRPFSTSDFARLIRARGYKIRRIPFEQWKKLTKKDPDNALYPLYPFINRYDTKDFESYSSWKVDNTNAMTALFKADKELIRDIPGPSDILDSVMDYLVFRTFIQKGMFGETSLRQMAYWEKQLKDAPVHTAIPVKPGKALRGGGLKGEARISIAPNDRSRMEQAGLRHDLDLKEMTHALVFVLLSRYSRQEDLLLSVSNSDMGRASHFIRTSVSSGRTFGSLAMNVKQLISEARAHGDLSADIFEGILCLSRDVSPVELLWSTEQDGSSSSLSFHFTPGHGELKGRISYDLSLYDTDMMDKMAVHLENLAREIPDRMDQPLGNLGMLSCEERDDLLYHRNMTDMAYPENICVHQLFTRKAVEKPNAVALVFNEQRVTYKELNDHSDHLAVYLNMRKIGKGSVVGIHMERSTTMITAVLGVLKSGAAYLPLDPDYPLPRLEHMIEDANADLVICSPHETREFLPGTPVVVLENEQPALARTENLPDYRERLEALNKAADPSDAAYIIYTSGSTGKPKGVVAMHRGLVNLVFAMDRLVDFDESQTMLCMTRLGFDMVKPELYLPLVKGGVMHILPSDSAKDGYLLRDFLDKNPVSLMQATPSSWRLLLYAGWKGNKDMTMITGGEALTDDLAEALVSRGKKLLNLYGPTETTVWSTAGQITKGSGVHIGYPLGNTKLYVLDQDLNPVPMGVPGELFIGGHGVTLGYHGQPDLTRFRYLDDPFDVSGTARMYRTGDRVRIRQDGALEYMERLDHQVKIRGYRMELKEIEHVLENADGVKEAVVLVRETGDGEKNLMAWVVPEDHSEGFDLHMLKEEMAAHLPGWMIPSRIICLESMPLNANGKVDRKGLPDYSSDDKARIRVRPVRDLEKRLLSIWEEVLEIKDLGITDDFFEWGGDSLKAMKLLVFVNERLGTCLTVQRLFENLTVQKLSITLERMLQGEEQIENDTAKMMRDDAVLEMEINTAASGTMAGSGAIDNVLLTGVTGYLGAYLLRDILEKTKARVWCLVRAKNRDKAFDRVKSNLETYGLWDVSYEERVVPLAGDLSLPWFGLDEETYQAAAGIVDAVFHNGAMVNFSYPYEILKKANVAGTRGVLAFSALNRIKPLYYVSTIGVFERKTPELSSPVLEDSELPGAEELYYGYAQSKWVAEKLVQAYRDSGMPVTVVRPGPIYGDSQSGTLNTHDFFCRMIRACMAFNAVPDLDVELDGLPVDKVSDLIVDIAFSPGTTGRNFNIVNPCPLHLNTVFDQMKNLGYTMDRVSIHQWTETVRQAAQADPELMAFMPLVSDVMAGTEGKTFFEMQTLNRQSYSCANLVGFLSESNRVIEPVHSSMMFRYLEFVREKGYISHVPEYLES